MLRVSGSQENSTFDQRLTHGLRFEDRVKDYMQDFGFSECYPFGLDHFPDSAKAKLIRMNDPTSLLLRFLPDLYCPVPGKFTFFIECKSKKLNSPFFSYNLESLNLGLRLADMGIKILVVFEGDGFRAQWIEALQIEKVYKFSEDGSGKTFTLIAKSGLPSLKGILEEILLRESGAG